MTVAGQMSLFAPPEMPEQIREAVEGMLSEGLQPSARELLNRLEKNFGWAVCFDLSEVLGAMTRDHELTRASRDYLVSLLESGDLAHALRGEGVPERDMISSIDTLVQKSQIYRSTKDFAEVIDFIALFRDYAPYNNMLVRVQNPNCSFYATASDWRNLHQRHLIEDARPMLILAPMHPVMLVYDLDQTEGKPVPKELLEFGQFKGEYKSDWLEQMVENAKGHRIKIDFKSLSSVKAGFATLAHDTGPWKMRIVVHDGLDGPSRLGVLCHELAHILLGHLGSDKDLWWPSRSGLTRKTVEIEAEAAAYITMSRFGVVGSSAAYVSRYLDAGDLPPSVSLDLVTKVAGYLDRMVHEKMPPRKPKRAKEEKKRP